MIGYFVKSGDKVFSEIFGPCCFAFSEMLEKQLAGKKYSKDLELILIEYHLEGKFLKLPDREYRVKSYRRSERSIAVVVGVTHKFSLFSNVEKKQFIVSTTLKAVTAVKNKLARKTGFDLESVLRLYDDIKECSRSFLELD